MMHPGARPEVPIPSDAERAEAEGTCAALAPDVAPATAADLGMFLWDVNMTCRFPLGRDDFRAKVEALHRLVGEVPRGALTLTAAQRMRAAYFPDADTIRAAVAPEVRRIRAEAEVLATMANGPTTSHPIYAAAHRLIPPGEFRRWIAPLRVLRREEERWTPPGGDEVVMVTFTLAAPSAHHAAHVQREYGHVLTQGLGGRVEFEVVAAGAVH